MLKTSASRKNIYWLMVLLIGGSVIIGLPGLWQALVSHRTALGLVNGVPIFPHEYRTEFLKEQRLREYFREQFGAHYKKFLASFGKSENIEQDAQEQLIVNKLLLGMALSIPVRLSASYIKRELAQPRTIYGILGEAIPASYLFTDQGMLKLDMLHNFLRHEGLNMEQFELMAEEFLTGQFGAKIAYYATIASQSARDIADKLLVATRTFEIRILDLIPFLTHERKNMPSPEDVESFYNQHVLSHTYWSAEQRSGTVWTFDLKAFPSHEKHTESGTPATPGDVFMAAAQQLILTGDEKAFGQFVHNFMGKTSSLTKIPHSPDITDPLIQALFSVSAAGERTACVSRDMGYIVEMTDSIAPKKLALEDVRSRVVLDILRERAQKQAFSQMATAPVLSFSLPPKSTQLPQSLARYKLPDTITKGLIIPGQSSQGVQGDFVYELVLIRDEPDLTKRAELGTEASIRQKVYEHEGELMLRDLIASLRNNAIITVQTTSEQL